jgi:hypothetical protein
MFGRRCEKDYLNDKETFEVKQVAQPAGAIYSDPSIPSFQALRILKCGFDCEGASNMKLRFIDADANPKAE